MSENTSTNVQLDTRKNGSVTFAADVVATIAGLAATEVEGVASMYSTSGFAGFGRGRDKNSKSLTRGVKVDVTGGEVSAVLSIVVEFGYPIPEVARNIQENVKKAVETMSGLNVSRVDVNVLGLSFEKENEAAEKITSNQRVLLQKKDEGPKDASQDVEATEEALEGEESEEDFEEDPSDDLADDFDDDFDDPSEEEPAEDDPVDAEDPQAGEEAVIL